MSHPDYFPDAFGVSMEHEGAFVNNKNDPGLATKWGMSLRTLRKDGLLWDLDRDGDVDADDVKLITLDQARDYYRAQWWERNDFDRISDKAIAIKLFDMAINMGATTAVMLLQQAFCQFGKPITVDGDLGPETLGAFEGFGRWVEENSAAEVRSLVTKMVPRLAICGQQGGYYAGLIRMKSSFREFERGWRRRANWWWEG